MDINSFNMEHALTDLCDEEEEMNSMDRAIFRKFKITGGDTLPFKSYRGTRGTLGELMNEFGYKTGAEIGVFKGEYSRFLCGVIPGLKLKCIDPWTAFGGQSTESMENCYQRACRRLRHFNVEIIRKPSLEAVKDVPDGSLDFIYIDEMHEFDPVILDLIYWSKKVRIEGMIAGHDYSYHYYKYGVIPAVDAYTRAHNVARWYITNERDPSFFWVKHDTY